MKKEFISIQEASELAGKSIQTIRRAIKAKKFKVNRQKTPQGFNYLIEKESFCETFKIKLSQEAPKAKKETTKTEKKMTSKSKNITVDPEDFKDFVRTMENLIAQHSEERKSFLGLINTMQEKIYILENQLNLLQAPQKKKWFSFFR
jgi:hypothetical protein